MKRISSLHLLPVMLCSMLIACAGEPTSPQIAAAPQFSRDSNNGNSNGTGQGQEHEPFPNLDAVAKYKGAPPDWSARNNHQVIDWMGGTLRVGDFQMIIPAGALDHATNFHIVLPVDPKEKSKATAEFGPHTLFDKDITIVLPYANTDGVAQIIWWNSGHWEKIPTWICDGGKRLCGRTNHFSVYAVWKGVIALGG